MQINPIIEKDIKTKMRGWKSPALLTVYLLILGGVVFLIMVSSGMFNVHNVYSFNPSTAVTIYTVLSILQFCLLMAIIPAITATTISSERERQTLDLLLCTDMKPLSIISGKLIVSIAHVMLLIFASVPFMAIVLMFGGVTLWDITKLYLFFILTALMVGSIGTFFSTLFKRNIASIIMTYIVLLIFGIGTLIGFVIYIAVMGNVTSGAFEVTYGHIAAFLFSNPGFGLLSFINNAGGGFDSIFYYISRAGSLGGTTAGWIDHFQPWMINGIFDVVVICLLTWLSCIKLKKG